MRKLMRSICRSVPVVAVVPCASASASVSLILTNNTATPQMATTTAGLTFDMTLELMSTAEQTTGIDYFLQDGTYTSGPARFTITSRSEGMGRIYGPQDTFFSDATVATTPSANLTARNGNDLGASLADPSMPTGAGLFPVSDYRIEIDPGTPFGTYTLHTISLGNSGYSDANFVDHPFDSQATFTVVNAVPGDANGDGTVNFSDVLALIQHYGQGNATWASGDMNGDGTVNFSDVLILIQHYGQSAGTVAQSVVPEPAGAALMGLAGVMSLRRRRRTLSR